MLRRLARLFSVTLLVLLIASGIGVITFAPIASANHETVLWSRYWSPGGFDARTQYFPSVFTDQQGGLYFFQYDVNPGNGNTNVTMWKLSTRGPFGNPQNQFTRVVNPTLPNVARYNSWYGAQWAPSVAMDHSNPDILYVAWADLSWNVYVSKSGDGGLSWGAPSRVDQIGANYYDSAPLIVAAPNGDLFTVWLQIYSPGNLRSLAAVRSTDQGVTWSNRVNLTSGADYLTHSLTVDSFGRLHLAYSVPLGPFPNMHSNYTWSDDGTSWSAPTRLDGGSVGLYPILRADASNRIHVIWYDYRQSPSGTNTWWYRRSDDRGATWTMEVPVSQGRYPTGGSQFPTLAIYGDTVIVAWYVITGVQTMGYAISADGGDVWSPEAAAEFGTEAYNPYLAADENGTFYAGFFLYNEFTGNYDLGYSIWDGPPSAPTVTDIARGSGQLTVSWTRAPEGDVAGYRLWRSNDGVAYELAGTFDATIRSYADSGLANGLYWYRVTSFDSRGTSSHPSKAMSASVGQSLDEEIADLQAQLAALQAQLDALNDSTGAQAADLRNRINDLQARLNNIQAEKATQAQSLLNTVLLVIVILLLVFMFMQSRRRAIQAPMQARPPPVQAPPSSSWQSPPPSPPTPPQRPPPSEPGLPDEEL